MKMNEGKENPFAVLIIVLILAVIGYWVVKTNPISPESTFDKVNYFDPAFLNQNKDDTDVNINKPISLTDITYEQALTLFKDTRIQFDKDCKAFPSNVTYKNNINIMIDNRAPVARTVKVGADYKIGAYGFKIIKLYSGTVPTTWLVDCDKSQNVATILLQK